MQKERGTKETEEEDWNWRKVSLYELNKPKRKTGRRWRQERDTRKRREKGINKKCK